MYVVNFIVGKVTNKIIKEVYVKYKDVVLTYYITQENLLMIKNDPEWKYQYKKSYIGMMEENLDWVLL